MITEIYLSPAAYHELVAALPPQARFVRSDDPRDHLLFIAGVYSILITATPIGVEAG